MKKMTKKLLTTVTLFFMAMVVFAQQQTQVIPLDPNVRIGKLENGLTYYIRHNKLPENRADFYIAQKVGSILEEENQRGLAHFLEHMCFNGTTNFPGKGIINWLESIGVRFGQNLNAYTSIEETVYNISDVPLLRESVVDSCLLILHDWANDLTLNPKEIDSERNVLIYQCFGIIFVGIAISMIICSRIIKRFTRSLTKLTSKAQELAKGNYELIVDDIDDLNEIKTLANSIKDAANQFDRSNRQINILAYTDSLTGLKNRHCFDKFCKGLEDSFQKNIGVIFCDLNRLKFTNDNFGHEAGDKLIRDFANILKENFPTEECFRMSGDEFIIVSIGLIETHFEQMVKDFIALNKRQEVPVTSVGSCWRFTTSDLNSMINEAEANMYRDKNEFYKRFPEFKR